MCQGEKMGKEGKGWEGMLGSYLEATAGHRSIHEKHSIGG